MRRSVIVLFCLFILPACFMSLLAQHGKKSDQDKKMNMTDFEKRKKEYVMEKAGLTQDEAGRYFPLSNELTLKKFELHKIHKDNVEKIKDNNNISDEEYKMMLENDVEVKLKEAALEKLYAAKFEKALPPEKLYKAQQAEKEFMLQEVKIYRGDGANKRKR